MKLRQLFILSILAAALSTAEAQTELYSKYASHTNIKVACVNNMQLDSASRIEVTTLEAIDDDGWEWILKEFNIGAQQPGQRSIMFSMRDRHDPSQEAPIHDEQIDQDNSCYIGVDFQSQTLYVFAALTGTPPDGLLKYLIAKMIRQ